MEGYVIIALKSIAVYVFIVVSVFPDYYRNSSKRKHKAHRILGQNTA
ncbi:hypothetical protein ACST14_02765 [Aquirufa sp. A-Brett2-15D]